MIEVIGWFGSALLVISLLQSHMMRLRIINLIASVILVGYNAAVETWPMVGMNFAVALINIYYIVKIRRDARAGSAPEHPSTPAV